MAHVEHYSVSLGERGRLVLPARIRRRLNLQAGDRLILTFGDDGEVRIMSARELSRKLMGMYDDIAPERSLVDELIAERREEARREDQER